MLVAGNRAGTASIAWVVLLGFVLTGIQASTSAAETELGRRTCSTENFEIWAQGSVQDLEGLGERCETLRSELRAKWFGSKPGDGAWSPRCVVVVHSDAASYLRAVPGGERTVGSSLVDFNRVSVTMRRIDVRGDREDWITSAMPHELTHVLLADRSIRAAPPRWAEEGLALLADPVEKQAGHDVDFRLALHRRGQFRLVELLTLEGYPSPERVTTFYGQSASLVRFLAAQGKPAQFVDFIEQATTVGHDAALRSVYQIDGVAALETAWLRSLSNNALAAK